MGAALARAVSKTAGNEIFLYDKNTELAEALAAEISACSTTLSDIAVRSDIIFLGVKPNVIPTVCRELDGLHLNPNALIVSMAAGIEIKFIQAHLSIPQPVIRIMPNTPASVGQGMILWCANEKAENKIQAFLEIMQYAGVLDKIPETLFDVATAVSGCGPAFAFMFIEALADAAVKYGLPRDKALLYAMQMLKGSAELALSTGKHPGALKDAVCSPGGSTIAGVLALETGAFRAAVISAVESSYKKTVELGKK